MDTKSAKYYPDEELAALVRSLDRKEDQHIFSQDVLLTHPHLTESYTKICPQRCDLSTAAKKALEGAYSGDVLLNDLRSDIELMVSNCIRFNGDDSPLTDIAENFESFAMTRLNEYISSKTGGRRVSSLRLKSYGVEGSKSRSDRNGAVKKGGDVSMGSTGISLPKRRDIVSLVSHLVRREDAGAFVVDVGETYPELKESYEKVCPQKMNLTIIKQRAQEGYYLSEHQESDHRPLFGKTVADSFVLLRADVDLIVSNCMRFNARAEAWLQLASSFQVFAHQMIDDFVLRYAPGLHGTTTGVSCCNQVTTPQVRLLPSEKRLREGDDAEKPSAEERASSSDRPKKRPHIHWDGDLPSSPLVEMLTDVPPSVRPTPLQPHIDIPEKLRLRLVADHIKRNSTGVRLVGETTALGDLLPPPLVVVPEGTGDVGETINSQKPPLEVPAGGDADRIFPVPNNLDAAHTVQGGAITVAPGMSAWAVMEAFRHSVHTYYQEQRSRTDFHDPFNYSLQDEHVYHDLVENVATQFNRVFLHVLLYPKETADVYDWLARRAIEGTHVEQPPQCNPGEDLGSTGINWLSHVHYSYLVRFLVHFPQMASLCCATACESPAQTEKQTTLKASKSTLDVVQRVTKVVQEWLQFVADFEATWEDELLASS